MKQLFGFALAVTIVIVAGATESAAETGCEGTGSWRPVDSAKVVMSVRAASINPGWTVRDADDNILYTVTKKMTEFVTKDVRFNGSDNGERNELTVRFRQPGGSGDPLVYTMTVQARKRKPEGVLTREIKAKGFDATGAACTRQINPYKKYVRYFFQLGDQPE